MGMVLASRVLPEPGGPLMRMLWKPAAAISRARLACSWPMTNFISVSNAGSVSNWGIWLAVMGSIKFSLFKWLVNWRRLFTGKICKLGMSEASATLAVGTNSFL